VAFREYIREEAKKQGADFVELRRNGKLKLDLEFIACEKNWKIGNVISCNIPKLSDSSSKAMRVESVQYTESVDVFTLIEDIGSI
jgi:hypothetical protein